MRKKIEFIQFWLRNSNLIYIYAIALFALHPLFSIKAQERHSSYEKYTTKDGLSGIHITSLLYDSKGYLWIGTNNGLTKYDGTRFEVFSNSTNKSFKGHLVHDIAEDKNGDIWIAALGLSKYEREENYWTHININLNENSDNSENDFVYSITEENDSIYWLATASGIIRINVLNLSQKKYRFYDKVKSQDTKITSIIPQEKIFIRRKSNLLEFDIQKQMFEDVSEKISKQGFQIAYYFTSFQGKHILGCKNHNRLLTFDYKTFEPTPFIKKDPRFGKFNFCKNKLYYVLGDSIQIFNKEFLLTETIQIDGLKIDRTNNLYSTDLEHIDESTIWLATNIGLFKAKPQRKFYFLNQSNGLKADYIRTVNIFNRTLIYNTRYEPPHLIKKKNNSFSLKESINLRSSEKFEYFNKSPKTTNDIIQIDNNNYLLATSSSIELFNRKKNESKSIYSKSQSFNFWAVAKYNDEYWAGAISGKPLTKFKIVNNEFVIDTVFSLVGSSDKVYELFVDTDNSLWVGGDGLYKMKIEEDKDSYYFEEWIPSQSKNNDIKNPVWSIIRYNEDYIIAGTSENGVFLVNTTTKKTKHFTIKNGLSSNITSSIAIDKNKNIWIGTVDGLNCFNTQKNTIEHYTIQDGLISSDFNFKSASQDEEGWLYWGTKNGLIFFHPDSIESNCKKAPLLVNKLYANGNLIKSELQNSDTVILNFDQNYISLEFSYLEYSGNSNIVFKYMLSEYDLEYHYADRFSSSIIYSNVPPGKYKLKVHAIDNSNKNILNSIQVPIIIKSAFYQTKVFKTTVAVLSLLIVGLFIYLIYRKQKLENKILNLQFSLLQSQMNPHFIFNTLNSIQNFILKNEKTDAFEYLTKFSRLIRMSLENSTKKYVYLKESISFLENYIHLESLKLKNKITYEIKIDPLINQNHIMIPPMLLQPFVENSINHGLFPKKNNMELKIRIDLEGKLLKCTIEDNGIGRLESEKRKLYTKGIHKSMGHTITTKRIKLLFEKTKIRKKQFEVYDKYEDNRPLGTTVVLRILYLYQE